MTDTIRIPLFDRDGTVIAYALIDAIDADRVLKHAWHFTADGYVRTNMRVAGTKLRYRSVLLHRFIMKAGKGSVSASGDAASYIDHVNHDKLDCRRCNLRPATKRQNCRNRCGPTRKNKSGHRGVHWRKDRNKWKAYLKVENKILHIGLFDVLEDAADAADAARRKHFGDHAGHG